MKLMINRLLGALALSLTLLSPALAFQELEGVWEIEFKDSRYHVTSCGPSGEDLCGELVWLAEVASTPENVAYMNTLLIDQAKRIGPNRWKGQLNLFGQSADGRISLVSDNQIDLVGCQFLLFCRTFSLYRME